MEKYTFNIVNILLSFFQTVINAGRCYLMPVPMISGQQKLMNVNQRLNNAGIDLNQATTRILYDTLPLDGRKQFQFFKEAGSRVFPFTNLDGTGQLTAGESIVVERYSLALLIQTLVAGNWICTGINSIFANLDIMNGTLKLTIANNVVMKPIPVLPLVSCWNKDAKIPATLNGLDDWSVFEFETMLVIPPMINFNFDLEVPNVIVSPNAYIRMTIEGIGTILAPRQTF